MERELLVFALKKHARSLEDALDAVRKELPDEVRRHRKWKPTGNTGLDFAHDMGGIPKEDAPGEQWEWAEEATLHPALERLHNEIDVLFEWIEQLERPLIGQRKEDRES